MACPVQVTFHGLTPSPALQEAIYLHAAQLERYHPHLIRCRAVVDKSERHGKAFSVKLEIRVEGHEIVTSHAREADAMAAMREAFAAARQRLQEDARRRGEPGRRSVRRHKAQPAG
jgi:ribosome-associated translation inhibitor RaiA